MSKQKQICFIGEKDIIEPFKALGIDTYYLGQEGSNWEQIKDQINNRQYQIVFVTEEVASYLPDGKAGFRQLETNVVILPNTEGLFFKPGKVSLGSEELRQVIIKAVGMDILVE